jgi:dTMP kinase
MAADRYHHQDQVITPAIERGQMVVCDRYVTTALVLDVLDGADPEFVWTIYRYMRWPALAIILAGDPAECQARVTTRGSYSRFHHGGITARRQEAARYEQVARMLTDRGYPVEVIDTSDRSVQQVADIVLARIRASRALSS